MPRNPNNKPARPPLWPWEIGRRIEEVKKSSRAIIEDTRRIVAVNPEIHGIMLAPARRIEKVLEEL